MRSVKDIYYDTEDLEDYFDQMHEEIKSIKKPPMTERDKAELRELINSGNHNHLRASRRFLIDKSFSNKPVAICDNTNMGLPVCEKGEGKYCYSILPCECKCVIDGEKGEKSARTEALFRRNTHVIMENMKNKYEESFNFQERGIMAADIDRMVDAILKEE